MGIAQFQINDRMMLQGRKWHLEKNVSWRKLILMLAGTFVVVMLFTFVPHPSTAMLGVNVALVAALAAIMGLGRLLGRWIFLKNLRTAPKYGKTMIWTFEDSGIRTECDGDRSEIGWNYFYETCVTPEGALLYPQKTLYYWIPASAFSGVGEWQETAEWLRIRTKSRKLD